MNLYKYILNTNQAMTFTSLVNVFNELQNSGNFIIFLYSFGKIDRKKIFQKGFHPISILVSSGSSDFQTFLGRLMHEIICLTSFKTTIFVPARQAWYDFKTQGKSQKTNRLHEVAFIYLITVVPPHCYFRIFYHKRISTF